MSSSNSSHQSPTSTMILDDTNTKIKSSKTPTKEKKKKKSSSISKSTSSHKLKSTSPVSKKKSKDDKNGVPLSPASLPPTAPYSPSKSKNSNNRHDGMIMSDDTSRRKFALEKTYRPNSLNDLYKESPTLSPRSLQLRKGRRGDQNHASLSNIDDLLSSTSLPFFERSSHSNGDVKKNNKEDDLMNVGSILAPLQDGDFDKSIERLKKALKEANAKYRTMQYKHKEERRQLKDLKVELTRVKRERDQLLEESTHQSFKVQKWKQSHKNEMQQLRQLLEALQSENKIKLAQQESEFEQERQNLFNQTGRGIEDSTVHRYQLEALKQSHDQEVLELRQTIEVLKTQKKSELSKQQKEFEKEFESYQDQLDQLQKRKSALEEERVDLLVNQQVQDLQSKNDKERKSYQNHVDTLQNEKVVLQKQHKLMKERLQTLKDSNDKNKSRLRSTQANDVVQEYQNGRHWTVEEVATSTSKQQQEEVEVAAEKEGKGRKKNINSYHDLDSSQVCFTRTAGSSTVTSELQKCNDEELQMNIAALVFEVKQKNIFIEKLHAELEQTRRELKERDSNDDENTDDLSTKTEHTSNLKSHDKISTSSDTGQHDHIDKLPEKDDGNLLMSVGGVVGDDANQILALYGEHDANKFEMQKLQYDSDPSQNELQETEKLVEKLKGDLEESQKAKTSSAGDDDHSSNLKAKELLEAEADAFSAVELARARAQLDSVRSELEATTLALESSKTKASELDRTLQELKTTREYDDNLVSQVRDL